MKLLQQFCYSFGLLVLVILVPIAVSAAEVSDPFAGYFVSENTFDGYINQNSAPTGAILLRTSKPRAGLGYLLRAFEGKTSQDSGDSKYKLEGPEYFFYGILPFSNGLHLGFTHKNADFRFKTDGLSLKLKSEMNAISFAGNFKNGFGFGLSLEQNREEVDVDFSGAKDSDVSWGIIRPQLYYSTSEFDLIVKVSPTMRHQTGSKAGFIQADVEMKLEPKMNLIGQITHSRSSEIDDDERNHFSLAGGARYIYDSDHSNITGELTLEEAYNAGPKAAQPSNIASKGLMFTDEHTLAKGHRLGGSLYYALSDGKGSDFRGNSRNITANETAYGLSYTCVF